MRNAARVIQGFRRMLRIKQRMHAAIMKRRIVRFMRRVVVMGHIKRTVVLARHAAVMQQLQDTVEAKALYIRSVYLVTRVQAAYRGVIGRRYAAAYKRHVWSLVKTIADKSVVYAVCFVG